jgi:hypothetical protein
MPNSKANKAADNVNRASVRKEMLQPRTARSARVAALNLDTTRNPEPPSTTVSGTVNKIIPSKGAHKPEKAQIAVNKSDPGHRNIRIKNELTDEHGDDVKLKKGAHVDVTVAAEPKGSSEPVKEDAPRSRRKPSGHDSRRRKS